jgi:hypothetical protein
MQVQRAFLDKDFNLFPVSCEWSGFVEAFLLWGRVFASSSLGRKGSLVRTVGLCSNCCGAVPIGGCVASTGCGTAVTGGG